MTWIAGRDGTPIIAISGWKKSGKTTLTERLVAEFVARGLRVATLKHAHHSFQVDDGNTDSARHRRAGAQQVAIVSRDRWAIVRELAETAEPTFEEAVQMLEPADLLLVEGYKSAPVRKIEARRLDAHAHEPLAPRDPFVVAVAADHPTETGRLPLFALDDVRTIADFIAELLGLDGRRSSSEPE
jgi:molybdopterin-guanine dinucleotide biosynthesis protein B